MIEFKTKKPELSLTLSGDGKVTFLAPMDKLKYLEQLNPNKDYNLEVREFREKRSKDANAYFHVLVNKIAQVLGKKDEEVKVDLNLSYGSLAKDDNNEYYVGFEALKSVPITKFFKYAQPFEEYEKNGKTFVKYLIYKETHTLDKAEMGRLIDGAVQEAQELGIDTRTPDEITQLKSLWKSEEENGEEHNAN